MWLAISFHPIIENSSTHWNANNLEFLGPVIEKFYFKKKTLLHMVAHAFNPRVLETKEKVQGQSVIVLLTSLELTV